MKEQNNDQVFYIKLKTGEELLGSVSIDTIHSDSRSIMVNDIIEFSHDSETGSTFIKYWIPYSEVKSTNIDLVDCYFFGLANNNAQELYEKFVNAMVDQQHPVDEDMINTSIH